MTALSLNASGRLLAPVAAQPGVMPLHGASSFPALPAARKAAVLKALGWGQQVELCDTRVSLRVTRGSLQDVVARIQAALPRRSPIEVRSNSTARFTLDLQDTSVGDILQAAANLAGYELYVFSDHVLLAPSDQFMAGEDAAGKRWDDRQGSNVREQAASDGIRLFLDIIPATLAARGVAPGGQIALAAMSPELQQMMGQLVVWTMNGHGPGPVPRLTPDGLVTFSADGTSSSLSLTLTSSQRATFKWTHTHDEHGNSYSSSSIVPSTIPSVLR